MRSAGANQIALMHCASAYPATFAAANVRAVSTLRAAFGVPVGFSDPTLPATPLRWRRWRWVAVSSKNTSLSTARKPSPDHSYALTVAEFGDMVSNAERWRLRLAVAPRSPPSPR